MDTEESYEFDEQYARISMFIESFGDVRSLGSNARRESLNENSISSTQASSRRCDGETDGASADGEALSKSARKKLAKGGPATKVVKEKDPSKWAKKIEPSENKKKKEKKELKEVEYTGPRDGRKKILDDHCMPEAYNPRYVEAAWQEWWETSGFYKADSSVALATPSERKFVMVIPPPNVTGSLHLGHALTAAIEDTLTRWHRMRGDVSLYVPGIDHAGIATQSVVEKKLAKEEGVSRHDLGRELFVERVWKWKEEYGGKIINQIRRIGSSVDWSREAFTMSPLLSRAVTEAFIRFHKDGLIYRDTRLVNWSCALKSAISDIEVEYVELEGRTMLRVPGHLKREKYEFGTLTRFAYKIDGSEEELEVATTRLETMLGDTGVAVHPDDQRYKHLQGKFVVHPFTGRKIPIITDGILVDMEFGTGAVKITPAHDPNDYECGKRNDLELINILNPDGTLNSNGAPFEGMLRYDARFAVEQALKEKGLFRGKEDNKMRLGLCSRSNDVIEPYLTPQWYVRCDEMAAQAVAAVREKRLRIEPTFHEKTWYHWLENVRDWCISRQLWWGHRIPAYFVQRKGEGLSMNDSSHNDRWFIATSPEEAASAASKVLNAPLSELDIEQDPDVLDTWFSSGLFPFSVFGWPEETEDFKAFYPTTLLETGMDILFFWVARMVMMGFQLTKQLPFSNVYLHPMVRDKYGRKMSKSLGNVIDPLEVIGGCSLTTLIERVEKGNLPAKEVEVARKAQQADFPDGIPECGADALRFGLLAYTVQGRDINLDINRVVGYRNFCNKLWNATRFALTYVTELRPTLSLAEELVSNPRKAPRDKWILSRLNRAVVEANRSLVEYDFAGLTTCLYNFWLYELCDHYLELIKPVVNNKSESNAEARTIAQGCLYLCLDYGLRLLHPIMPYVTEDLWQRLPGRGTMGKAESPSIMLSRYPEATASMHDPEAEANYELVKAAIHTARSLRSQYGLTPQVKASFILKLDAEAKAKIVEKQIDDFSTLARAASCEVQYGSKEIPKGGYAVHIVDSTLSVCILLKGLVDVEAEVRKLRGQLEKVTKSAANLTKQMEMNGYEVKVPEQVRVGNLQRLQELAVQQEGIEAAIRTFRELE